MATLPVTNLYYAVKEGWFPGVFYSQKEFEDAIFGYKGFQYAVFTSEEEAKTFVEIPLQIYTDGALDRKRKRSGIGVYSASFSLSEKVKARDINLIEFLAITRALEYVSYTTDHCVAQRMHITIFTDSQCAIRWCLGLGPGKWSRSRYFIEEKYINYYRNLVQTFSNVTIKWTKGHKGKNIKADLLAKKALN